MVTKINYKKISEYHFEKYMFLLHLIESNYDKNEMIRIGELVEGRTMEEVKQISKLYLGR